MARILHSQNKSHLIQIDGEYTYVTARDYLINKAYADEHNVIRWESNNRIPFEDMLMEAGVDLGVRRMCETIRDNETQSAISQYIAAQAAFEKDTSPEAMAIKREQEFERRAAFGEGAEVMDVFSGRRYWT